MSATRFSLANERLVQVVTIDADGNEDVVCPCVPEVFAEAFIEMYNRSPSPRRAMGREVVAVVVGGDWQLAGLDGDSDG